MADFHVVVAVVLEKYAMIVKQTYFSLGICYIIWQIQKVF
jgi:hypothetical protein